MPVWEVQVGGRRWSLSAEGSAPWQRDGTTAAPDSALQSLLAAAALASNARLVPDQSGGWQVAGDPRSGALLLAAERADVDPGGLQAAWPRLHEVPSSPEQGRMSVVCETPDGPALYVQGAPESVLPMCSRVQDADGREGPLAMTGRQAWLAGAGEMAGRGLRVLAIAWRPHAQPVVASEQGLCLLGLAGMVSAPCSSLGGAAGIGNISQNIGGEA